MAENVADPRTPQSTVMDQVWESGRMDRVPYILRVRDHYIAAPTSRQAASLQALPPASNGPSPGI